MAAIDIAQIGAEGSFPGLETVKWTPGGMSLDIEVSALVRAVHAADAYAKSGDSFRYRMEADAVAGKIEQLQVVAQAIRAGQRGEG